MIIGVVGGGQLARMMIPPAVALGIELRVLAEQPGMAAELAATAVGDYRDLETVRSFARDVDVLTFDHEHVPQDVLRALVADGVRVHPGPDALRHAQDKLVLRRACERLGLPQPEWAEVRTVDDLTAFLDRVGGQAILKRATGGYDGKGVRVVRSADDAADWIEDARDGGPELLAEELVEFRRELAQVLARTPSGDLAAWPVVHTVQRDGICVEVLAPADDTRTVSEVAEAIARTLAVELGVTGVFAVELFETTDDRLLINELAMRPHNSGHWTIDGAVTSQFEQHVRAVADLPLGATTTLAPAAVMVNVIGGPSSGSMADRLGAALAASPAAKVHDYGKRSRPGRKVGHVTAIGADIDEAAFDARAAAAAFDH